MLLNKNTVLPAAPAAKPIQYALQALRRDFDCVFADTAAPGGHILLSVNDALPAEQYALTADENTLLVSASDDLGFVYGLLEISRRFLGVQPFWFWNDQTFETRESVEIPAGTVAESKPYKVKYRGWFINDETLLSHWKVERRSDLPFIMAFETLLRLGGNMVIPGTGKNAHLYRQTAADMGLIITHHHAEPLGAEMFAQAYPGLEPMYSKYPEKFRALWQAGIDTQKGMRVIWNIGFRGQGDRPFWEDDPQYDTPAKRGALISALIKQQYDLVKANDKNAVCCTNLYGETMELYKDGFLDLPADVIKIWADNGYGKMVSRRQGNANPRVPALPPRGDNGAHGIYYHASFYDLQAASHITMLPNSAEFVTQELTDVLAHGADDYWLVNCSNVKPHTFLLDLIARCWRDGTVQPAHQSLAYAAAYYGLLHRCEVAQCLTDYARFAVPYGPNEDDRAGDQFYNHVPRMLAAQFIKDRTAPADDLRWLCDAPTLQAQTAHCAEIFNKAVENYTIYCRECELTAAELTGRPRTLFWDTVLLQARLYDLWAQGAAFVCKALDAGFAGDWQHCFYYAGSAKRLYALADRAMRDREHGKWIDFYANECQTDVKQTAQVCGYLMSFARTVGEGPHYWEWMREFGDPEDERRVLLILNTDNHPTDEELWRWMEQRWGE
ncbi:glycosyl hydrolase 115 family protein [Gemmiger sp.]